MNGNGLKIWKWMVGVLIILNIILMVSIWKKPSSHSHHYHKRAPGGPAKMIIEELNLSGEQVLTFEKLKRAHADSIRFLQMEGKTLRDNFFALLGQEHPDKKLLVSISDSIGHNQKAIELLTFSHFRKVREICNAEQKERFDMIIKEVLASMAGLPGRPGPHMRK